MMMAGLAPIDTSDKVFSITPSSMSVGSVTAIDGFTLGADAYEVKTTSAYGSTAKVFGVTGLYLGGPLPTQPLFETKAKSRDVVVRTWSRLGMFLLRCDRSTGRAIYVSWTGQSTNGSLFIGYASNVPATFDGIMSSINAIGTTELFSTDNLASYVTGWNTSATDGDEFEISVIGSTITVKWNSQTVFTSDVLFCHMVPGTVLYVTNRSEGALRDTEITFKASASTYTDGDNRILDFRDWGFKQLTTTGSMSAASTTLTVASAAGFAIGDPIMVETGGEAGAGALNTIGVGGTWPRDRYANVASLPNATTYRAANGNVDCYVWVEDVQSVYINFAGGGTPAWGEWTNYVIADTIRFRGYRHTIYLLPRALCARITNISGNTITLDTPSVVATTNANVYYDCSYVINYLMPNSRFTLAGNNAISNDGWEVRFPAGTFCIEGEQDFPWGTNWTYKGAGRSNTVFYAPKGAQVPYFTFYGDNMHISDFKIKGWAGVQYYSWNTGVNYPNVGNCYSIRTGGTYRPGGFVSRVDFENTWGGINFSARLDGLFSDSVTTQTNGNIQQYASWFHTISNSVDTFAEDITYNATEVGTAFEIFACDGGGFRRCTSTQGLFSSNSSGGGFLFEDCVIDINYNYIPASGWLNVDSPAININSNVGASGNPTQLEGGTIRNPTVNIVKRASDGDIATAISVNGANMQNVTVEGTHPAKPGAGVITMSNYAPGDVGRGAVGVIIDRPGCVVRGIRVIGTQDGAFGNISAYSAGNDCVIQNCVADSILLDGVEKVGTDGNITNAEYEALP